MSAEGQGAGGAEERRSRGAGGRRGEKLLDFIGKICVHLR